MPNVFYYCIKNSQQIGNKKLLVLDLDETLVHSTFKDNGTADFTVKVNLTFLYY
jgi:TFIIF-interacting CTD phosphatase-like protein